MKTTSIYLKWDRSTGYRLQGTLSMTTDRNNQRAAADRRAGHQNWVRRMRGAGPELLWPLQQGMASAPSQQGTTCQSCIPPSHPKPCSIPPFAARQETRQLHPVFYSHDGAKESARIWGNLLSASPQLLWFLHISANRGSFSLPQFLLPPLLKFSDNNSSNRRWRSCCNLKSWVSLSVLHKFLPNQKLL